MFLACGVGAPQAAMFHVTTHAFFKALLFLCAGNIIHALNGEQDIRYMGGLRRSMPWTFRLMTLGALGLAGFPLLAGFFSKDAILLSAARTPWLLVPALFIPLLTAAYTGRLLWTVFFGEEQQPGRDPGSWELHTLWPLALGTLAAGWFGPHVDGPAWIPWLAGALSLAGLWWGRSLRVFEPFYTLFHRKWFVDEVYRAVWLRGAGGSAARGLSRWDAGGMSLLPAAAGALASLLSWFLAWWDRVVVDGAVRLAAFAFEASSYPVRLAQTGGISQYALVIALTAAGVFAYSLFRAGGAP
jgi:NADH-quinone oxidoreductase subunit L